MINPMIFTLQSIKLCNFKQRFSLKNNINIPPKTTFQARLEYVESTVRWRTVFARVLVQGEKCPTQD